MTRRDRGSIETEIAYISGQLDVLRRRETEMDSILRDVARAKDSISSEIAHLDTKQRSLIGERLPINWIPAELLIDIMVLAANPDSTLPPKLSVPVVLTQVCQRWRQIAESTPELWAGISFNDAKWATHWIPVFLERSKDYPLEVEVIESTMKPEDSEQGVVHLLELLDAHFSRVRSLSLFCVGSKPLRRLLWIINDPVSSFSRLRTLSIGISDESSKFFAHEPLESMIRSREASSSVMQLEPPKWCRITTIRLENLPLFSVPPEFLRNISNIELEFTRVTFPGVRSDLQASVLLKFLTCTPQLEFLHLISTHFELDILFVQEDGTARKKGTHKVIHRISLPKLRGIDWAGASQYEMQPFFSLIDLPALEQLRIDPEPPAGYREVSSILPPNPELTFPSLTDLHVRAAHDNVFDTVIRKCSFPSLKSLAISSNREGSGPNGTLTALPKLESMFRDPRLPGPTHLLLASLSITTVLGKEPSESMLGYLPALQTLALDSCDGGQHLLTALERRVPVVRDAIGRVQGGGIKFCPQLQTLSVRNCEGIGARAIGGVLRARNVRTPGRAETEQQQSTPLSAQGTPTRRIIPLRRGKKDGESVPSASIAVVHVDIDEVIFEGREALPPHQARMLKSLGVQVLLWNGDEFDEEGLLKV